MSLGTQIASPSGETELERSGQIRWDDILVPGVQEQIRPCTRKGRTYCVLGKFNTESCTGPNYCHLYRITANRDGKNIGKRCSPSVLL